jgi:hypothetical protein
MVGEKEKLVGKGQPLPRIAAASPLDGRRAQIQWQDGRQVQVDLAPAFTSLRIFRRVRDDDALFGTLTVDEYGDALVWEDGAELSAVWIEELAAATLGNAEFREAMDTLHLTLDGMAARLGIARRLVADYRKDKPIPKHIALATRYLLSRLAA